MTWPEIGKTAAVYAIIGAAHWLLRDRFITISMTPDEARDLFATVPGVIVRDDPANDVYPLPTEGAGVDEVFVGRIRAEASLPAGKGLAFWVVSDNLRKGAAYNAVQIAQELTANYM